MLSPESQRLRQQLIREREQQEKLTADLANLCSSLNAASASATVKDSPTGSVSGSASGSRSAAGNGMGRSSGSVRPPSPARLRAARPVAGAAPASANVQLQSGVLSWGTRRASSYVVPVALPCPLPCLGSSVLLADGSASH